MKTVFFILFFTQLLIAPFVSAESSAYKEIAEKEKRTTERLFKKRQRKFIRLYKYTAAKQKRIAKNQFKKRREEFTRSKRKMIQGLFRDAKTYYDAHLYKDAIAIWYEIVLLGPYYKYAGDDRKVESFIIRAQREIKKASEIRRKKLKLQAERECRIAKAKLRRAKKRLKLNEELHK